MDRMRRRRILLFLVFTLTGLFVQPAYAQPGSAEDIFKWVSSQMNIRDLGKMPAILYVDRQTLCTVFEKNNQKSYLRWKARYGVLQARKILSVYFKEIMGLYDPGTSTVYVSKDLSSCRRDSILAHEFTHHFQYHTGMVRSNHMAFAQRFKMESEAHQIEYRFLKLYCPPSADCKSDQE